jgi:hypothetical protein
MNPTIGNQPSGIFLKNRIGLSCGKENITMKNTRRGFSLMETMIGLCGLILLSMISNAYMMAFMKSNTSIREVSQATAISNTVLEKLRMKSYDALSTDSETVNSKYRCSWTVTSPLNSGRKLINLSVKWPLAGGTKTHNIEISTIRAQ